YDVADPRRLKAMMDAVRGYATGGQRSVYECFLTAAERGELLATVDQIINPGTDAFLLVRLEPRRWVRTLGIGVAPEDPPFFYQG
ncbi:MAG: CRISPR-associated endonuclease Cas2, partial [Gammaproteobacteria bacterium]|nr:CRISPR-associated endonuclease Cas2 [Gammaproteobacteria bacterium]